jgi:hypothetical protein
MNSYIKPPALSTSFSESGKRAKKRFDNILNTKVKKTGAIAFVLILVLIGIVGTMIACNQYKKESNDLYSFKNTSVDDARKIKEILTSVSYTEIYIKGLAVSTFPLPVAIEINYKADNRTSYRYKYNQLENGFNKSAAIMFSLIPDVDEIHFRIYDDYITAYSSEEAFASFYYNRQNLSERFGMEYLTQETVRDATTNIDTFETYMSNVSAIKDQADFYNEDQKQGIEKLRQVYSVIGDECEITVNSQLQVFITVTNEIATSKELRALLESININLDKYIGKKIEFSTYNIRNFKTNQSTSYLFVFDGEKLIAYEDLKAVHKDREVMDVLRVFADEVV